MVRTRVLFVLLLGLFVAACSETSTEPKADSGDLAGRTFDMITIFDGEPLPFLVEGEEHGETCAPHDLGRVDTRFNAGTLSFTRTSYTLSLNISERCRMLDGSGQGEWVTINVIFSEGTYRLDGVWLSLDGPDEEPYATGIVSGDEIQITDHWLGTFRSR